MKKALSLLLTLVICLSLCACGEDVPDTTENDTSISGTNPSTTEPPATEAYYTPELSFEASADLSHYIVTGLSDIPKSTDIVIPATYQGHPVTEIKSRAFADAPITSVVIPEGITTIYLSAFSGCSKLVSVNIPNSVTSIEPETFKDCISLTSISIPDTVTYVANDAFDNCTNLSFNVHNGVKYLGNGNNPYRILMCTENKDISSVNIHPDAVIIASSAFWNCTHLTNVTIPDNIEIINNGAFFGCVGLTSIEFPNNLTRIGGVAFKNCSGLTTITIPEGISCIEWDTFSGCTNLTDIYFSGTMAQWSASLTEPEEWNVRATIHCTDGDIAP